MTSVRPDTAAALLREVAAVQSASRLPSLVAGVVRDGELVWSAARGRFADRGGALPGPDTQYRIGSITKTLTAILVMQCRDDGLLALSDPIGKHLPGIGYGHLTVRNLLAHSGGMNAEPVGDWWERNPGVSFEQLAAALDESIAAGVPDRRFHYSNLGFGLLGELVTRLRDKPWMELAQARVLDPLGMRRTTYLPQAPAAQGFSIHPWTHRLDDEPAYDSGAMAPAGQLWSTLEDLARYASFWIDPVSEVLAPATVDEMAAPMANDPNEGLTASYGLGLRLHADDPHVLTGHTGSMPGFLAGLFVDRGRRIGAVTLANATSGKAPSLALELVRKVGALEPPLPPEWVPEPELPVGEELLGPWHWGNTPYLMTIEGGILVLANPDGSRVTRFRVIGKDLYEGLDGYFAGERLQAHSTHLNLATFILTRTPYAG
ncbi:serine hydrolase domain-containing protein [Kribbella deserti]|uniref:Serine hydrolase domain-containing protein n=1 Tax=Kribbella deserti TaxID=1926257 RepID=A0ABV6QL26_9ACTN